MPDDTKNNWLLDQEEAGDIIPPPVATPPEPQLTGLDDINKGRQEKSDIEALSPKPVIAPPVEQSPNKSEPAEPITEKTFAKLLENVVKFSGDANISMEKCIADLQNVLGKINYSTDKSLESKVKGHLESANGIKKSLEELNQSVSGYRKSTIEGGSSVSEDII